MIKQHIKSLDGFRAVAVIAVMLVHYGVLGAGWIGVQMFFVLSGYLISANLIRDKESTDSIKLYLKNFYWRRFLRLFPAYYIYVVGFIVIGIVLGNSGIYKLIVPLLTYTLNIYAVLPGHADLANVGHFWSLAVEEQFYLLWPFLIFFLSSRHFRVLIIFLLLIGPVLRLALFLFAFRMNVNTHYAGEVVNILTIGQIDAFAMGAAIAFFPIKAIKRLKIYFFVLLFLVAFVGGLNLISLYSKDNLHSGFDLFSTLGFPHLMINNFQYIWGYSILNLLFGILILCIINGQNPLPILSNSILTYIGKISYGIYVFHVPVLFIIHKVWKVHFLSIKGMILFTAYFLLTFLIAHISFKYYEKRFLILKDRLTMGK